MEIHFEKDYGSIMITPMVALVWEEKFMAIAWLFWGIIINF